MSARSRGRGNPNQDADEERRLWKEIKDKAKEVDGMVVSIICTLDAITSSLQGSASRTGQGRQLHWAFRPVLTDAGSLQRDWKRNTAS